MSDMHVKNYNQQIIANLLGKNLKETKDWKPIISRFSNLSYCPASKISRAFEYADMLTSENSGDKTLINNAKKAFQELFVDVSKYVYQHEDADYRAFIIIGFLLSAYYYQNVLIDDDIIRTFLDIMSRRMYLN